MSDPLRPRARPDRPPEGAAGRVRPVARPEGLGQASPAVAEAATVEGALTLDRAALLGLFDKAEGREALLRLPSGEVVRARSGDVVAGGVVTAVGADALHLWRDGALEVLTLPA